MDGSSISGGDWARIIVSIKDAKYEIFLKK
jgi:hypothetical protein